MTILSRPTADVPKEGIVPHTSDANGVRKPQLAYSELQEKTHDEERRRRKARKITAVLQHFLGRTTLDGLAALDIGSSTGFTAEALATAGASVVGLDIDEPGIRFSRERFAGAASFAVADGSAIPLSDQSMDIVVFNHIYEHVVDPDAVLAEIVRVLRPDGVAYFGFGNRWQVIEPHYRLPMLSWLPAGLADRYVARSGRAASYYERFRSRTQLVRMCQPLHLWDYTYAVLADAERFSAEDVMPSRLSWLPPAPLKLMAPIIPTFIWIGTPGALRPAGPALRLPPRLVPASGA
jgi:ubiquinone/menaquinone biosynthesis C-methylase UbiE